MTFSQSGFAKRHFSHIADRKARNHLAETALVHIFFQRKMEGTFVEVGANHPTLKSMTWHLECAGWRGLLVEPIPAMCDKLREARPNSQIVQAACTRPGQPDSLLFCIAGQSMHSTLISSEEEAHTLDGRAVRVQARTLDSILDDAALPQIDLLSIDVEGATLDVLAGLDLRRHRPALLLIEDHLYDWRIHRAVARSGYQLVKRTGVNNWYVPLGTTFQLTSLGERLRLWRRVWLGTPLRGFRHRVRRGS